MAKFDVHPLMRTIVDNPDLDAPRLVYADWLDEQGDPKLALLAEYIRIEVELDTTTGDTEQRRNLGRRREELFKLAGSAFRPPMPGWAMKNSSLVTITTMRGLPNYLECTLKQFARGGTVLEYAPIISVYLRDHRDYAADARYAAAALARQELIRVRDLTVWGPLGDDAFAALAANPHVSNLRKLKFYGLTTISDVSAKALASAAPRFSGLEELSVDTDSYEDGVHDALHDGFGCLTSWHLFINSVCVTGPPPPSDADYWS